MHVMGLCGRSSLLHVLQQLVMEQPAHIRESLWSALLQQEDRVGARTLKVLPDVCSDNTWCTATGGGHWDCG